MYSWLWLHCMAFKPMFLSESNDPLSSERSKADVPHDQWHGGRPFDPWTGSGHEKVVEGFGSAEVLPAVERVPTEWLCWVVSHCHCFCHCYCDCHCDFVLQSAELLIFNLHTWKYWLWNDVGVHLLEICKNCFHPKILWKIVRLPFDHCNHYLISLLYKWHLKETQL